MKHSLKTAFLAIAFFISILFQAQTTSFRKEQIKNARVKTAYGEKWSVLKKSLAKLNVDTTSFQIFIRCFKKEKKLEVWIKSKNEKEFKHTLTYPICAVSGDVGPKRKEGDGQIPEGFYHVNVFNPYSNYHLSLGINYPNKSDKVLGSKGKLGGDIMIHGNCVTIGCLPLTDDKIKEVYLLAVEARNSGQQQIPVHIFPTRMDATGMAWLQQYNNQKTMIAFWENIKPGYTYFEKNKKLPVISVNEKGLYVFK